MAKLKHIAVLKGGLSSEREISLSTGAGVSRALVELGYKVSEVDVGYDVAEQLAKLKPDAAFNALHGTYGEDGCIQGVLEFLRIPYTHSGVRASAVAMHKPTAKLLFEAAGIRCAPGKVLDRSEIGKAEPLPRPFVIKPVDEGSSVGVIIMREGDNRVLDVNSPDFPKARKFLAEQYIGGRELTVGVLDGEALGVIEVKPNEGFYDYKNKYTAGRTEYLVPPPEDKAICERAMAMTVKAYELLECRGVARADIRCNEKEELFMLEINTHPGMTPTSLVPKLAKNKGISFNKLVEKLIMLACLDQEVRAGI